MARNSTLEGLLYGIGACVRIVVFEKSAYSKLVKKILKMSLRMNLISKTTHAIRISLWHVTVPLLYGIGAVCVRIVVFEKSAYLVKKF